MSLIDVLRKVRDAYGGAVELSEIGKQIAMKTSGLTEVVDVENNIYDEEVLKRSLPYVTKLNIETNDQPIGDTITTVIVEYRNGLSMQAYCTRTPIDTVELVNIAVCGSQQVLSTYVHKALFSFAARERVVSRRELEQRKSPIKQTDLIKVNVDRKFSDTTASCDFGRFADAVPSGAPSLRDVLLTIPMSAVEKDHDLRSSAQVRSQSLRDRIIASPPPPPAPLTINKEQATRATKAMADLLKAVRIDDNNTPDHPDEGEY